ncbi:MAG: hypothetical protein CML81_06960 [Rhodobiaceae bacterium]|nr:hypothetical protein [Rhodobiaceae bacterium]RPF96015.1 MAG: hypothetical protein CBD87_006925 [Rhizobiales bacterium TMED227]|tara:strand:- start:25301 stop:26083 length:783 start_codon:yes stop_codon:yes gene_type:complete
MSYLPNSNVLYSLVRNISKIYRHDFGEIQNLHKSNKSITDFTDKIKKRIESIILEDLSDKYGKNGYKIIFINDHLKSDKIWASEIENCFIVNVLEGETNFMRAIPFFAITIAHKKNNIIQNSIICNPITDDIFIAERGIAATHNNIKMKVSEESASEKNILILEDFLISERIQNTTVIEYLRSSEDIRKFGCQSLEMCMIADGIINAYIGYDKNENVISAALLVLRESGGVKNIINSMEQNSKNYFIVSNQKIYDNLLYS